MDRVNFLCFVASFTFALGLDLWNQFRPRPVLRLFSLAFGIAGLIAQTIYLGVQQPPLSWQSGWLLTLAWILAIFYLFGTLHHPRLAWGVFVLPLILGLIGLAWLFEQPPPGTGRFDLEGLFSFQTAHKWLLFLAAVGLCVGFLASLMYLVQARRLRAKMLPGQGLRLLSLERLETMNRRAVLLAFPLLTLGMLLGGVLLFRGQLAGWADPRVLASIVLWLTFAILLYLRLARHVRGRQAAVLTIVTFALLLCCLTLAHPVGQGGGR
jgi:ABC-type transport system involved in cytochrome c biogenesis permease subunit